MQFEPSNTQAISYVVNNLNQYTSVTTDGNPATITHDQNGNLTSDSVNSFTYDAENKLLTAAMGGGANVSYLYDPLGRRAQKDVNGTVTEYLHDGTHVIAEYDGSGNVLRRYVHGPGTDRPIAMVEGAAHSYYHADRLGSVVALTDDSGAPVAHYTYDAYGIPYLVDPGTGAQTQVAAGQPYLFTGRRFDFETGLYYYRARYYSASLGRFLQTDPIGYDDQMNLYAYVGNDPVNAWDPSGTCTGSRIEDGGDEGRCANGGFTSDLAGSAEGERIRRAEAAVTNDVSSTGCFTCEGEGGSSHQSDGQESGHPEPTRQSSPLSHARSIRYAQEKIITELIRVHEQLKPGISPAQTRKIWLDAITRLSNARVQISAGDLRALYYLPGRGQRYSVETWLKAARNSGRNLRSPQLREQLRRAVGDRVRAWYLGRDQRIRVEDPSCPPGTGWPFCA